MSMMRMTLTGLLLILLSGAMVGQEYRTIEGTGNNTSSPTLGSAGGPLVDNIPPAFEDGISQPARPAQWNARRISNYLFEQTASEASNLGLSDFAWAFGQFVDHDISLVKNYPDEEWQTEGVPIVVPDDDAYMTPGKIIPLMRSESRPGTGTDISNPRKYNNQITAFLDASAVYGSSPDHAAWLRTFEGGKLKSSKGNRLPWNTADGEFNSILDLTAPEMEDAVGRGAKHFVAGDIRANENPLLLSLHLLFAREHNRLCQLWLGENPQLDPNDPQTDEWLYQRARKVVGGQLQKIVYSDWLPSLGVNLSDYTGYDPNVDPSISNIFSAAAFRWGHTAINLNVLRSDLEGEEIDQGHIGLADAFFNPLESLRVPVEAYLKGMGMQAQQRLDCKLVGAVRNFLFKDNPVLGGLDLAAINIQRGRERGLSDYNSVREAYGLLKKNSFLEICIDDQQSSLLEDIYGSIENIDPWVGILAEDQVPNSLFGELALTIMSQQFEALRDGDRFFYLNDNDLTASDLELIESTTLSELIMRNTELECLQDNAFFMTPHDDIPCWPEVLPSKLEMATAPNPVVGDQSFLSIYSTKEGRAYVRIIDAVGRTISVVENNLVLGENQLLLDWSSVTSPGNYYVVLDFGDDINALNVTRL